MENLLSSLRAFPFSPLGRCGVLLAVLSLAACDRDSARVDNSIPRAGQAGVDDRTIIALRLSSTMGLSDAENTDARNMIVTGDQTEGVYAGSIVAAHHSEVHPGQTIEEFQQGGSLNFDPENPDESPADRGQDTLVFLLDPGVSFKPGERVEVYVSDKVTILGRPLADSVRFNFVVAGGADRAEGEFFVTSTDPVQGSANVAVTPVIRANVSESPLANSLTDNVVVRGSISGYHSGGGTSVDTSDPDDPAITHVLAVGDHFVPGEEVSVALKSEISSAGGDLDPYVFGFQVRPGSVGGGWTAAPIEGDTGDAVAVLAADFLPEIEGTEFVVATSIALFLYRRVSVVQNGDGAGDPAPAFVWEREAVEVTSSFLLRGAVVLHRDEDDEAQSDDDGVPRIVALLENSVLGGNAVLQEYSVTGGDRLEASGTPSLFEAESPDGLFVADIDSDGQIELFVTHDEGEFTPVPPGVDLEQIEGVEFPPESTGHLTVFELGLGLGQGGIDLVNLDNLLELQFTPVRRPIPNFERSSGIGVGDFDNDGRLDLINDTVDGLVLYRNQTTTENPNAFRRVGLLRARDGEVSSARVTAWAAFDVDGDDDTDIITWDDQGALLHGNRFAAQESDGTDEDPGSVVGAEAEPLGLLFETVMPSELDLAGLDVFPGDQLVVSNVDGDTDGRKDIVIGRSGGETVLLVAEPTGGFRTEVLGSGSSLSALAVADVNDDTGLDIITVTGDTALLYETAADGVAPPPFPEPVHFFFDCVFDVNLDQCEVDEDGVLEVAVRGDLTRAFTGYSITLDYDQSSLDYLGFVPPESFEPTATFSLCPSESGIGCFGFASARMAYRENTIGAPFPDVELGVFRFGVKEVDEETVATIRFTNFEAGGQTFSNRLFVSENNIDQDVPVGLLGDSIEITLNPPPPPPLTIACSVEERFVQGCRTRVEWASQLLRFDSIQLTFSDGEETVEEIRSWDQSAEVFDISLGGIISVSATALRAGEDDDEPATASCEFVNVFRPTVTSCSSVEDGTEITWMLDQQVDSFNVYRNNLRIGTVSGNAGEFTGGEFTAIDVNPSEDGSDLYEVTAVLGGQESLRGNCAGDDPGPCNTEDPDPTFSRLDSRTLASTPNKISFRWRNGEAYDQLNARLRYEPLDSDFVNLPEDLFGESGMALESGQTELEWDGDPDRGGARPGSYTLTLLATNDAPEGGCGGFATVSSNPVVFNPVVVPIPQLGSVAMSCRREGVSDVLVTWNAPWRGFGSRMTLTAVHKVDDLVVEGDEIVERDILLSDSSFLFELLEPIGSWEVTLAATHEATQDPDVLTTSCGPILFEPGIRIDDIEVPIGTESFEIEIRGDGIFGTVIGYDFELEFPDVITIDGFESLDTGVEGRSRVVISSPDGLRVDSDADGDGETDGSILLRTLTARVPVDAFDLASRPADALTIVNPRLRFQESVDSRAVNAVAGSLSYIGRWLMIDRAETLAGSDDELLVAVSLTFTAPPAFPEYRFGGFQIHLEWDPDQLELLPFRDEDLVDTVLRNPGAFDENEDGLLGEIFPPLGEVSGEFLESVNSEGDLNIGWLNFPGLNPLNGEEFLRPVVDGDIIVCRFRSRLPSTSAETFAPIRLVVDPEDPGENRTTFFPDRDVPGVRPIDAFFDGGVLVRETGGILAVSSMSPTRGPITGGNVVTVHGRGFDGTDGVKPTIRFRAFDGSVLTVPSEDITLDELNPSNVLRFVVPDALPPHDGASSSRALPGTISAIYNVEVESSFGIVSSSSPYFFDVPSLSGVDITSVRASGGDILRLTGAGFSTRTEVEFHVDGFAPIAASPLGGRPFDESGRTLIIVTPSLPAPAEGEPFRPALLVVRFEDVIDGVDPLSILTLEDPIHILPSDGEVQPLRVTSLDPDSGVRCEETEVHIRGEGFTPSSVVLVGGTQVESEFVSVLEIRATIPVMESVGGLTIEVRDAGIEAAGGPLVFDSVDPPDFIRGDVDASGGLSVGDATLLAALVLGDASSFPPNRDALDANDDGSVNLSDVIRILGYLFGGQGVLPEPFGEFGDSAGQDPTGDDPICR